VILEKSLQILIFRPYIFASFHQVLSKLLDGLGVKALFSIFLPKILQSVNILQKTLPNKKFYSHNNEKLSAAS
jgi:hypothetical protein